jgi:hypothetical protein
MKNRRRRLLAVAVIGPALAICAAGPGAATRAGATFSTAARSPGTYVYSLITVGMPDRSVPGAIQAGVVDVYFHDGRKQTLTEKKLGLGATAYGRFGASIAVSDLNNDGLADLIVGAPGVLGKGLTGHIDVLFQSAAGFVSGNASPIDGETTDDQFGTAVAVSSRLSSPVVRDLWVGAPGNDFQKPTGTGVETISNAGDVSRYDVAQNGQIAFSQNISQATPNIPDTPEKNDRFGEVLAPATNGVVVGIPHEDVGTAADAGEVIRIRTDAQTIR